jgi:hypothetical protein
MRGDASAHGSGAQNGNFMNAFHEQASTVSRLPLLGFSKNGLTREMTF